MITGKRIEELIKQGVTIYEVKYGNVNPVSLKNKIRHVLYKYGMIAFEPNPNEKYLHRKYFKNLYETKEQAEFAKEFKKIPKITYLDLPFWEESKEMLVVTKFKSNNIQVELDYYAHYDTYVLYTDDVEEMRLKATRENYTTMCEKVREYFKAKEI